MRKKSLKRLTKETSVNLSLNIDGKGQSNIKTGLGFFDHMLELLAFHSNWDLNLTADGDLQVDSHHLVEDVGLVLGRAAKEALGDKLGIERYGTAFVPMDEALVRVVIDISGRPCLVYGCDFYRQDLGQLDLQNVEEFFKSFSNEAGITCHIECLYGSNDHHKVEAVFKGFARAFKEASKTTSEKIQSSKGVL